MRVCALFCVVWRFRVLHVYSYDFYAFVYCVARCGLRGILVFLAEILGIWCVSGSANRGRTGEITENNRGRGSFL